jgi:hypothetical protein
MVRGMRVLVIEFTLSRQTFLAAVADDEERLAAVADDEERLRLPDTGAESIRCRVVLGPDPGLQVFIHGEDATGAPTWAPIDAAGGAGLVAYLLISRHKKG